MKRRSFLKSSLLSASLSAVMPMVGNASINEANKKSKREFYELRIYTLKNKEQEKLIETYFEQAAIPALNDLGSKNIGVFKELKPNGQTKIYVVIPFASLNDFAQTTQKLSEDERYIEAGADYLNAPEDNPAYEQMESSLHMAFTSTPKLTIPEKTPRIFEWCCCESANEMAGKKKIEMLNNAGEIEIFKRVGLTPVFFAETLIGTARPGLNYMLTYTNMAAHDRALKGFNRDQDWKLLRAMPEYNEEKIVSRASSVFLVPAGCSQI